MDVTPICHPLVTLTLDTVDADTEIKSPNYCLMFAKVWQRCRRQFVDSGYYVEYGAGGCGADEHKRGLSASNKLEHNYSLQQKTL